MNETNTPRTDQWTDFAGKFLKAEFIDIFPVTLVCSKIEGIFDEENNAYLFLELAYKNKKWKFEVNKTNQRALKDAGITKPTDIYMKKLTFDKTKVRNPATKQIVDSLIIVKVE